MIERETRKGKLYKARLQAPEVSRKIGTFRERERSECLSETLDTVCPH